MMFPLVLELAVDRRIPVAVTCRVTRLFQTGVLRLAEESGVVTRLG